MKRPEQIDRRRRVPLPTWAAVTIGLLGVGVTSLAVLFFVMRAESRARIADMETRLGQLCAADDSRPACQKLPPNVFVQVAPSSTSTIQAPAATTQRPVAPTSTSTPPPPAGATTTTTARQAPPSSTSTIPPTTSSTPAPCRPVPVVGGCSPL